MPYNYDDPYSKPEEPKVANDADKSKEASRAAAVGFGLMFFSFVAVNIAVSSPSAGIQAWFGISSGASAVAGTVILIIALVKWMDWD